MRDGKSRDEIFVEGLRLCEEAFAANLEINEVFVTEPFTKNSRHKNLLDLFSEKRINSLLVSEKLFESIADTETPQGIALIANKPKTGKEILEISLAIQKIPLVVVLHEINNPNNLGAILRTAEAIEIAGIILTKNSANPFSPKSLRSAMGAVFRFPIWTNVDFNEAISFCREHNLRTISADIRAEKTHFEINWKIPRALFLGSEAHGLSEREFTEIGESLKIPMAETVESLNLAVSAGIIFYESLRQKSFEF